MGRIIEKRLRLRRHYGNDIIYPKTLASLVITKDGDTVEEAIETIPDSDDYIPADALVTSVTASSTDKQVPSAKCMYTAIGNIESLLAAI